MIGESHLNVRDKCPEHFMLIGRSKPIMSASPRGGIAVYKRIESLVDCEVITDELRDCVLFRVLPVDIVVAALYIPPSNSKYSSPEYMQNLQMIMNNFKDTPTFIIGDLNSRYGEMAPTSDETTVYTENPDKVMNSNGRSLIRILREEEKFLIVNGLNWGSTQHENDFTFFRGSV